MSNFDRAFELTIGHEGGYTNNPKDRGNWTSGVIGKGQLKGTKYGVSAMSYPDHDIKSLTLEEAKDIYRQDYWYAAHCDSLPDGVDYLVFDTAINSGRSRAQKLLQAAVGSYPDGVIGPNTMEKVRSFNGQDLICEFSAQRACYYASLSTFSTFGKGWMRRLTRSTVEAVLMRKDCINSTVGEAPAVDQSKGETQGSIFGGLFRKV